MSRTPVSHHVEFSHAFVLTGEHLKKIDVALRKFADEVEYEVDCEDKLTRKLTLKSLMDYENAPGKRITQVTVEAKSTDRHQAATVRFCHDAQGLFGRGLHIRGPESEVTKLKDAIAGIYAGMRPWYAIVTKPDFTNWLFALYALLWLGLLVAVACGLVGSSATVASSPKLDARAQLLAFGLPLVCILVGSVMNRFRSVLFPTTVFAVGQGRERHECLEKWRWIVVGTIAVGFIVNLVAGLVIMVIQTALS